MSGRKAHFPIDTCHMSSHEIRAADAPLDGFSGERGEFRKSEGLRGAGSKE